MIPYDENNNIKKPDDWPQNNREISLSNVLSAMENFIRLPNYANREVLFSLIDQTDLNERNDLGAFRITKYEIEVMNKLYYYSILTNCNSLKMYLYGNIMRFTQFHKFVFFASKEQGVEIPFEIEECNELKIPLKIFYLSYAIYNLEKNRSFSDCIIKNVKLIMAQLKSKKELAFLVDGFNNLFKDLSFFTSSKVFRLFKFSRTELLKLFQLQAFLLNKTMQSIIVRPLMGVIKITIRNWVLKSRNNYNNNLLYKCISDKAVESILNNHEIWMQKIEYLNDKREQKVIREIYKDKTWIKYDWAKRIKIDIPPNSFVTSFSKAKPSDLMLKKYGKNVFGYKTDRIADLISPTYLISFEKYSFPFLDQVFAFDIIYSQKAAQDEINYLCQIIDCYRLSDIEKNLFFNSILVYWYLSFKDKKWEYEHERRYQFFIYNYRQYNDVCIDSRFLKMKSSIFLSPDFIFTNKKMKEKLKSLRLEKLNAIGVKNYFFCSDCLQADFDLATFGQAHTCPICGSTEFNIVEK